MCDVFNYARSTYLEHKACHANLDSATENETWIIDLYRRICYSGNIDTSEKIFCEVALSIPMHRDRDSYLDGGVVFKLYGCHYGTVFSLTLLLLR